MLIVRFGVDTIDLIGEFAEPLAVLRCDGNRSGTAKADRSQDKEKGTASHLIGDYNLGTHVEGQTVEAARSVPGDLAWATRSVSTAAAARYRRASEPGVIPSARACRSRALDRPLAFVRRQALLVGEDDVFECKRVGLNLSGA